MAKKMTKKEMFKAIMDNYNLTANEVEFLEHEIELLDKKNSNRKPTKAQSENENIKSNILDFMEQGKSYTITEIQKGVGLESNQKTSALVRLLKVDGLVTRVENKGKAYFTKA